MASRFGNARFAASALAQDDDYVVRVVRDEITCSGTLIREDQVLTARHCVAFAGSGADSQSERAADPGGIQVELGGDYLPWGEVGVRAVITPPCEPEADRGDIAILVLERELVGLSVLEPQLELSPEQGQDVTAVGFGRCALRTDGIRRRKRAGGAIERLRADKFQLLAAICPGDSGGPGLLDDGRLIGVISASDMDGVEATRGLSEFTRLDAWRPVFAMAALVADGQDPLELPPLDCPAFSR